MLDAHGLEWQLLCEGRVIKASVFHIHVIDHRARTIALAFVVYQNSSFYSSWTSAMDLN
jgi:hypothetical protein